MVIISTIAEEVSIQAVSPESSIGVDDMEEAALGRMRRCSPDGLRVLCLCRWRCSALDVSAPPKLILYCSSPRPPA
eukprot:758711-Hanusia_phi.AAC.2